MWTWVYIAVGGVAIAQFGWWTAAQFRRRRLAASEFRLRQNQMRSLLDQQQLTGAQQTQALPNGNWRGFRRFEVSRVVKEADQITSVYLAPRDGKPIASFRPGQHLTLRLNIPGQSKPTIRCYSLSDSWRPDHFRITVKTCPPPPDVPEALAGLASSFINQQLQEGAVVECKAPAGSFYLDLPPSRPIVMLSAGIGITPMISMLNHELAAGSQRLMLLVVAVRNSQQHAFRKHLEACQQQAANFKVLTCYSNPLPEDRQGRDYDFQGRADVGLLQQVLPHREFDFFMCGPPPFMSALYQGLIDWGVPDARIHFEAFGPASVKRVQPADATTQPAETSSLRCRVEFIDSGRQAEWNEQFDNLLDMAETLQIPLDSGCRAGNCGTCEVEIEGPVEHATEAHVPAGKCLACIARPTGDIKIKA